MLGQGTGQGEHDETEGVTGVGRTIAMGRWGLEHSVQQCTLCSSSPNSRPRRAR